MSKQKQALGQGIRALLENMDSEDKSEQAASLSGVSQIPLTSIEINPFQPRADFEENSLNELAVSIGVHGVIQPITVRRLSSSRFQLISGERRLRAAKLAGLEEIPAYIRAANDQEMLEIALIENIQREDLNAMEIAINYQRLIDECALTHDALSERVGKDRSTVTNYLRLLKLPPEVQGGLKGHKISMGHARALIGLGDPIAQLELYKVSIRQSLSVRQVEKMAAQYKPGTSKNKPKKQAELPAELRKLQDGLSSSLSTRVMLRQKAGGKGEIVISYFSDDDLYRIADLMR